jgi:hypothetical protein
LLAHTPEIVKCAALVLKNQRSSLKNYRVMQNLFQKTTLKDGKSMLEERKQVGYFTAPNQFIFQILEKKIDGVLQPPSKNETSIREEFVWLREDKLEEFEYSTLPASTEEFLVFYVSPLKSGKKKYKGELWISRTDCKLGRIHLEESERPKEIESYMLKIDFLPNSRFQVPEKTRLRTRFSNKKGVSIEIDVEVIFSRYEFNLSSGEIPKN